MRGVLGSNSCELGKLSSSSKKALVFEAGDAVRVVDTKERLGRDGEGVTNCRNAPAGVGLSSSSSSSSSSSRTARDWDTGDEEGK
jgi:hypothetical protein